MFLPNEVRLKGAILDAYTDRAGDPSGPLPYADIFDPQTLNKYVHVRNNPLRYIDPDDLQFADSASEKQFGRLSAESPTFGGELNAAKADPNMDVTVRQVDVQSLPDHAPADATASRDANGVVHMVINTNANNDSNAAHEVGHENDARTNTNEFFRDGKK